MTVQLTLKRHPKAKDMVEMWDVDGCLSAVIHIDTFWEGIIGTSNNIYAGLTEGETIVVELKRIIDPCLDPQ